jgi:trk system potassium uptake protein TrkA
MAFWKQDKTPQPARREFVVIGLGRFGGNTAKTLVNYGHDVLAIDSDPMRVQHYAHELPHVIQMDATNVEALTQAGVSQFHTGIVCISDNFEHNLLAAVHLLHLGVQHVVVKARTNTQKVILQEIGVHEVILPETEVGVRLGRRLAHPNFIDYLEIKDGVSIIELLAPESLQGSTLGESDLRQRFKLNVVAVQRDNAIISNPGASFRVQAGDVLMVIGLVEDAERFGG